MYHLCFVGSDLCPNCLQKFSPDKTRKQRVKYKYHIMNMIITQYIIVGTKFMRESRKFCQRGSKFDNVFFFSCWGNKGSKNRFNWAIIGSPAKRHLNGVSLACRW